MAEPEVMVQYHKHARQQKQRIRQLDDGKPAKISRIDGMADYAEHGQEGGESID